MEEQTRRIGRRFFCHKCDKLLNILVNPNRSEVVKCPDCGNGSLELVKKEPKYPVPKPKPNEDDKEVLHPRPSHLRSHAHKEQQSGHSSTHAMRKEQAKRPVQEQSAGTRREVTKPTRGTTGARGVAYRGSRGTNRGVVGNSSHHDRVANPAVRRHAEGVDNEIERPYNQHHIEAHAMQHPYYDQPQTHIQYDVQYTPEQNPMNFLPEMSQMPFMPPMPMLPPMPQVPQMMQMYQVYQMPGPGNAGDFEVEQIFRTTFPSFDVNTTFVPFNEFFAHSIEINMDEFGSNFMSNFNLAQLAQAMGTQMHEEVKNPPASKQAVSKLPIFKINHQHCKKDANGKEELPNCAICFSNIALGEPGQLLPCGHMFHPPCIKPWLNEHNTCPICRYELPTDDPYYEERRRQTQNEGQFYT